MKKLIIVAVVIVVALVAYLVFSGKEVPKELASTMSPDTSAKVAALTGSATITRADGSTAIASVGATMGTGDSLSTEESARCAVEFEDGSTASMSPKTDLSITKLDKKLTARMLDIELKLDVGKILMDVPQGVAQKTSVGIATPSGSLGVRGTNFATDVDQEQATRVAVFEGVVEVTAQDQTVSLSADQTTMVKMGEAPAKPAPMLPAPSLEAPKDQEAIKTEKIPVKFGAIEGAKQYLVEMAQNDKFTHIVAEVYSDQTAADVGLAKDYRLWIRVSAINDLGLQGKPSEVRTVSYVFHQGGE